MNTVVLIGRLTIDPQISYVETVKKNTAKFTIAVNRPVAKGKEKEADFFRILVWGKQADNCEKYTAKGLLIAIEGRLRTDNYKDQDGKWHNNTYVIAENVEFMEWANGDKAKNPPKQSDNMYELPSGFTELDDDGEIPF